MGGPGQTNGVPAPERGPQPTHVNPTLSTSQQQAAHFVDNRLPTLSTKDCPLINNPPPNYLRQMIRDTASCLVVTVQPQQLCHPCLILARPALLVTVTSLNTASSSEAQGL